MSSSAEDKKESSERDDKSRTQTVDRYGSHSRTDPSRRSVSPQPTLRSVVVPAENGPFKDGKLIKPLFRPHRFRTLQFNCELCNVQCSSEEVFDMHLRGQKHLKKQKRKEELEKAGLMDKIQESETYCKLCSVELTSKTHMLLHLSGRRHKQNLMKELSAKNEPIAKTTAEVEEFEKKQAEEEEHLIKKAGITDFAKYDIPQERKAAALAEGARNEYYCSVCTKFFSGKTQLAMHLLSVKHREKEFPQSRLKRGASARAGRPRGFYRDDMIAMAPRFHCMPGPFMPPGSFPPMPGQFFRVPAAMPGYPPVGMPCMRPPLLARGNASYPRPYMPQPGPLLGTHRPCFTGDNPSQQYSPYLPRYRQTSQFSPRPVWNTYTDCAPPDYWRDGMAIHRSGIAPLRNQFYSDCGIEPEDNYDGMA